MQDAAVAITVTAIASDVAEELVGAPACSQASAICCPGSAGGTGRPPHRTRRETSELANKQKMCAPTTTKRIPTAARILACVARSKALERRQILASCAEVRKAYEPVRLRPLRVKTREQGSPVGLPGKHADSSNDYLPCMAWQAELQ